MSSFQFLYTSDHFVQIFLFEFIERDITFHTEIIYS